MICTVLHKMRSQVGCLYIGSSIPLYTYPIGDHFLYPFFRGTCFSLSPFFIIIIFYLGSDRFFFHLFADKEFIVPNLNLVNWEDLNRILRSEIFLHKDDQLCATHVILKYTLISFSFQSLKHVIKAKDPRIMWIDIVVPEFQGRFRGIRPARPCRVFRGRPEALSFCSSKHQAKGYKHP